MELFERMQPAWLAHPEANRLNIIRLAFSFVDPEERFAHYPLELPEPTETEIVKALNGIAGRIKCVDAARARAARLHDMRQEMGVVFLCGYEDGDENRLAAEVEALKMLFVELCRACRSLGRAIDAHRLGRVRLALDGIETSAELAVALDPLKREAKTDGPRPPRTETEVREAQLADVVAGLHRDLYTRGLVFCDKSDFLAWLAPSSSGKTKVPERPLKWLGTDAQLLDFVKTYNKTVFSIDLDAPRETRAKTRPKITAVLNAFRRPSRTSTETLRKRLIDRKKKPLK